MNSILGIYITETVMFDMRVENTPMSKFSYAEL